ncbi:hypothetical protein [uncultured Thiothrix sp.]|uniref:hypothetical protein n=1 Tax=uncultured Thiothrix sp. TaxID=223185 RepID=UPI002614A4D1|nr:hypothetical protein [uncultured Thiothrix sp.]
MSNPVLRKIHAHKATLVKWIDKQGNKSMGTWFGSSDSLRRFVATNNEGVLSDYFVVESCETDEEILSAIDDNQVLAWGWIT